MAAVNVCKQAAKHWWERTGRMEKLRVHSTQLQSFLICCVQLLFAAVVHAEDIIRKCCLTKKWTFNHILQLQYVCYCESQNCRSLIPMIYSTLSVNESHISSGYDKMAYSFSLRVLNQIKRQPAVTITFISCQCSMWINFGKRNSFFFYLS
jgi:hypothetical protein